MVVRNRVAFVLTLCILGIISSHGQVFDAKIIGGFNASQLEGDDWSGFNKIGLQGGLGVTYRFANRLSTQQVSSGRSRSIELLFNQKGSSSEFSLASNVERTSTELNYVQIPLLYSFDQWYDHIQYYHRISLEGGLYYARLFDVGSSHAIFTGLTDHFTKNDAGFVLGARYRFQYNWSFGLRYDHSFLKVFEDPNSGLRGLLSYLISLRIEFHF